MEEENYYIISQKKFVCIKVYMVCVCTCEHVHTHKAQGVLKPDLQELQGLGAACHWALNGPAFVSSTCKHRRWAGSPRLCRWVILLGRE